MNTDCEHGDQLSRRRFGYRAAGVTFIAAKTPPFIAAIHSHAVARTKALHSWTFVRQGTGLAPVFGLLLAALVRCPPLGGCCDGDRDAWS